MEELSWITHEHPHKERTSDWVWYAGLISVIASALSFYYKNIFFGIFILVAGFVVIVIAIKKPREMKVMITKDVLFLNEAGIPLKAIERFWLDETGELDKLLLRVRGSFAPRIEITLEGVSAEDVREFLTSCDCKEEEIRPSISAKVFDRLGF